jgi:hypothetical protein
MPGVSQIAPANASHSVRNSKGPNQLILWGLRAVWKLSVPKQSWSFSTGRDIPPMTTPLSFVLVCSAGWINRRQRAVIEYLQEEVRVLQEQLGKRPRFTDDPRRRLAVKGKSVGRKGLLQFASIVTPDTLLAWHCRLIAKNFDGTKNRGAGRHSTSGDLKELILKMARENRSGDTRAFKELWPT